MPMLIDRYVPRADFQEQHALVVNAAPAAIIAAAAAYRTDGDRLFRVMIGLRELPMRLRRMLGRHSSPPQAPFGVDNFTLLDRREDEIVYGLAGRFWQADFGLHDIADGAAFLALHEPGIAKLVINFRAVAEAGGRSKLTTQTRVTCLDPQARRAFMPYWYLIRPVSGLIRRRILRTIRHAAERSISAAR